MEVIQFLQQLDHPVILTLMRVFSFLGNELFYLLVLPILLWCWNKEKAVPLAVILLLNFYLNFILKELFQIPRPDGVALVSAQGLGFPSGHAQSAVVLWGYLAWVAEGSFWLAGMIVFLIGLSRIYLGVHFAAQVVAGWTIGFAWLVLSVSIVNYWRGRKISMPTLPAIGLAFLISLWMMALYVDDFSTKVAGAMFGLVAGVLAEGRVVQLSPKTTMAKQVIKVILGVLGIVLIKEGLAVIFPEAVVINYGRYAATGLWIGLGAPWVFVKLGMGNRLAQEKG